MALTSGQLEKMRRDEANRIVISNPEECYYCKNTISTDVASCTICSFPQKGTQEEMRRYVWNKQNEKRKAKEAQEAYNDRLKKARWISFVIAITFVIGFVMETDVFNFFDVYLYGIYLFFISSFLLCGFFMLQNPRVCASISLGLYVFWIAMQLALSSETWYQGALIKVIFIAGLVYGVKEAYLNKPPSLNTPDLNILDEEFLSD